MDDFSKIRRAAPSRSVRYENTMQVLRDTLADSPHRSRERPTASSTTRKGRGGGGRERGSTVAATIGRDRQPPPWFSASPAALTTTLEDRVDDLVVVEFRSHSTEAQHLKLSVRGLYQYVLSAITGGGGDGAAAAAADEGEAVVEPQSGGSPRSGHRKSGPARGRRGKKMKSSAPNDDTTRTKEGTKKRVTYRDRLGSYLSPKDLRRLAIPVSKRNEPEIIVRRHVICVNMDPLPAIILRDRLLVIVPLGAGNIDPAGIPPPNHTDLLIERIREAVAGDDGAASRWSEDVGSDESKEETASGRPGAASLLSRLAPILSSTAGTDKREGVDAVDPIDEALENEEEEELEEEEEEEEDDTDEWKEIQRLEWLEMPFELQCLDSILSCSLDKLVCETREVHQASRDYIHRLVAAKNKYHRQDPHLIICAVKDAISEITSRVRVIVKALARMLDDYEDMALMNLSRVLSHPEIFLHPVPFGVLERESDQPELILEAHLQTALSLESTLELVKNQIESASVLIEQNLDAVRNRLLLANMIMTVVSVCIGLASLVGSFMGMNLLNGIEDSNSAFLIVVVATSAASLFTFLAILGFLFYSGTIPVPGLGGG